MSKAHAGSFIVNSKSVMYMPATVSNDACLNDATLFRVHCRGVPVRHPGRLPALRVRQHAGAAAAHPTRPVRDAALDEPRRRPRHRLAAAARPPPAVCAPGTRSLARTARALQLEQIQGIPILDCTVHCLGEPGQSFWHFIICTQGHHPAAAAGPVGGGGLPADAGVRVPGAAGAGVPGTGPHVRPLRRDAVGQAARRRLGCAAVPGVWLDAHGICRVGRNGARASSIIMQSG